MKKFTAIALAVLIAITPMGVAAAALGLCKFFDIEPGRQAENKIKESVSLIGHVCGLE